MKRAALSGMGIFFLTVGMIVVETPQTKAISAAVILQTPIPIQPGTQLKSLSLSDTSVGGGISIVGRAHLLFLAPRTGAKVTLQLSSDSILPEDLESPKVQLPSSVVVPQGETDASFTITTFPVLTERHITVEASSGGITKTASFTIEPLQVASMAIFPAAELGPFQAQGIVRLNFPAPSDTNVELTSNNPEAVRFGTIGHAHGSVTLVFHQNESSKTFSLVASPVPQTTTAKIRATLNGKEVSQMVTVRH
ncbi:MAG: hypothetical protein M3Y84_10240 [Acidobacteriota bacterium]|nr:hypothetical protein [Acidobacteriota bacterium]